MKLITFLTVAGALIFIFIGHGAGVFPSAVAYPMAMLLGALALSFLWLIPAPSRFDEE